ncbi:MAG: cellulase family glycosylhydrolase [Planctomycetota bacterium]|jgi:endo-1,4-beta-mannosidase
MRILVIGILVLTVSLPALAADSASTSTTNLTVQNQKFNINGKPTFLLGISYYAALGGPKEFIEQDLEQMKKLGFNWIRVWATWNLFKNVSAVDEKGNPREPYFANLKWLVEKCDRMGIVVDLSLTRGSVIYQQKKSYMQTLETHTRALENMVSALKPYRNWYIDLANERNIRDKRYVSIAELALLQQVVKRIDARRLVTASYVGDINREELKDYLLKVKVDFISPHRLRNSTSPAQTGDKSREYLKLMKGIGRVVPIH